MQKTLRNKCAKSLILTIFICFVTVSLGFPGVAYAQTQWLTEDGFKSLEQMTEEYFLSLEPVEPSPITRSDSDTGSTVLEDIGLGLVKTVVFIPWGVYHWLDCIGVF